ncbi:hypothetical protein D3C87_2058820 [compost metagenome]
MIFQNHSAKYDYDGHLSRKLRQEYWGNGAANDWIYLFYHATSIAIGKPNMQFDRSFTVIEAK